MTEKAEKNGLIAEEELAQLMAKLTDLEKGCVFIASVFERGSGSSARYGDLTVDAPIGMVRVITALYSTNAALWGQLRALSQQSEMVRRYYESVNYIKEKNDAGHLRPTQKELESKVGVQTMDYIKQETKIAAICAKCAALKDALDTQLKSMNMIISAQRQEYMGSKFC